MEFVKIKLLNAITRPTLWKNIDEYIQGFASKDEYNNDWNYLYMNLDADDFINKYYPDSFVNGDKSAFTTVSMVFAFLQEITEYDNRPYYPKGCPEEETDKDVWETSKLLSDIENFYKNKAGEMTVNLNRCCSDEWNPLYDGREDYISGNYYFKEIKPKQSLLESFIVPKEQFAWNFLREDFAYKVNAAKIALKGHDEEYNEKILSELYKLCLLVMDDKYFWEGREITVKEAVVGRLKTIPDRIAEENAVLEDKALKKIVWSADAAICLYNYYCLTKNDEIYDFFLKTLVMTVMDDKTKERWETLSSFSREELVEIFTDKYENIFHEIKNENQHMIKEIFRKVKGKEDLIFKKKITENDILNFEPYSSKMFLLSYQFYSFSSLSYFLPESDVFKNPGKSFYKTWLLGFVSGMKEEADEYFKGNKTYYELTLDRKPLVKEEGTEGFVYKTPDYSNIPKDYDFTEIKKSVEMYTLDDDVRGGYLQIIKNKEKIACLYPVYRIFRDNEEISAYIE